MLRRSARRLFFLIAAAAAAACSGIRPPPGLVLEIVRASDGESLLCAAMQPGEEFDLRFVHSVNRRPVVDTLRIEPGRLVVVKSRYDAFGAGMPEGSTEEGRLAVLPDGRLEWTVERALPEIAVRVGRVAEHTLIVRGRRFRLADLAAPGTAVILYPREACGLDPMKGRWIP